jgi:uncharacterized delta-60 repeat protein
MERPSLRVASYFTLTVALLPALLLAHCGSDEAGSCANCATADSGANADGAQTVDGAVIDASDDGAPPTKRPRPLPVDFPVDPTFGGTGFITTAIGPGFDSVRALRRQADGKILVGGNSHSGRGYFVSRFSAAGALDPTFGNGGSTLVSALSADDYYGGGIALQADGKIVVGVGWGGVDHPYVVRLDANGDIDPSYGVQGRVTLAQGIQSLGIVVAADGSSFVAGALRMTHLSATGVVDTAFGTNGYLPLSANTHGLAIEPSGKLLTMTPTGAVARYSAAGALDMSFGTDGVVATGASTPSGPGVGGFQIENIAVQPDGKMLAFRPSGVARYTTEGAIDDTFGSGGVAAPPPAAGSLARGALSANGQIVVATQQGAVLRFTQAGVFDAAFNNAPTLVPITALLGLADGSVLATNSMSLTHFTNSGAADSAFGAAGTVKWSLGDSSDRVLAMARQADGKILALGSTDSNGVFGKPAAVLVRYGTDGLVDSSFGSAGKVHFGAPFGSGVAVDGTGNIVIAGYTDLSAKCYVARYTPAGQPDPAFHGGGAVTFGSGTTVTRCYAVAIDGTGRIVLVGKVGEGDLSTETFLVARLTSAGELDTSLATTGLTTTDVGGGGKSGATAVALQSDGKILVGGQSIASSASSLVVTRYLDTGVLDSSFDTDGVASVALSGSVRSLALQSDGQMVFLGAETVLGRAASGSGKIGRLGSTGALDTTFAGAGTLSVDLGGPLASPRAVRLLPDGRIAAVGLFDAAGTTRGFVARLTAGGAPDTTFAGKGYGLLAAGDTGGSSALRAVVVEPGGKVIAGGEFFVSPTASDFALLRVP